MAFVETHNESYISHVISFFKNIFVLKKPQYMKILMVVFPGWWNYK